MNRVYVGASRGVPNAPGQVEGLMNHQARFHQLSATPPVALTTRAPRTVSCSIFSQAPGVHRRPIKGERPIFA